MMRARLTIVFLSMILLKAPALMACSVCGGASDSQMAKGMNWGIFSLLAVIVPMLMGIAGFFVFLAKKSAQAAASSEQSSKNVLNQ